MSCWTPNLPLVLLSLWCWPAHVQGQYDFPIDSCACHIHYEIWVQQQYQISQTLSSPSFPEELFLQGSAVHRYIMRQECSNPLTVSNILEWTLSPANSDCAPGHMSQFVLCAQKSLLQGNVMAARRYFDFANYIFPVASHCMDPAIWTITEMSFYHHYRAMVVFSEMLQKRGLTASEEDLRSLAWRPVEPS